MVHLNKNRLTEDQLESLFNQLNATLGKLSSKQASNFLSELLGKEERVMLAKRLAAIVLLIEGMSLYKVSDTLKVSSSTAKQIKSKLDQGDFAHIINTLGKDKNKYFVALEAIDNILHLGGILPHRNGLDRYNGI